MVKSSNSLYLASVYSIVVIHSMTIYYRALVSNYNHSGTNNNVYLRYSSHHSKEMEQVPEHTKCYVVKNVWIIHNIQLDK